MKRSSQRSSSSTHWYGRIWRSRTFVVLLGVVLVLVSISVVQELFRRVDIQREITTLSGEVERLHQRNQEMEDLIALFNTSAYQDKQARIKLGLQDPAEKLVILPGNGDSPEFQLPNTSEPLSAVSTNEQLPNPQKWVAFFKEKLHNSQSQ